MSASILHVETRHLRGGAERNVNHFAAWQARAGHRVGLAIGRDSLLDAVPDGVEGIMVEALARRPHPIDDLSAVRSLQRVIAAGPWDVVHTHQSKAGVVGRLAARGRARLILHTVHMVSFGPGYGRAASTLFHRAERLCAGWTDDLIAVGDELRERYLAAGIGRAERFRVIRSPIDVAAFEAVRAWTPDQRRALREGLGLPGDEPVVLVVSALETRKRVGLIIDRLAPDVRSAWRLVVAGDARLRADLEHQAATAGVGRRVTFLGHRDDVAALMGAADVLVHAAEAEGVPQVIVQGLAAGLPIVATDVIGLREVPGATVSIGAFDGSDLRGRASAAIAEPGSPVGLDALRPWSIDAVEAQIASLHTELGIG